MASRHVLIIGGHGKIAQFVTPLLLQRSWTVTSLIRHQDQAEDIKQLDEAQTGKLNVLVSSVEDVTDESKAKAILDQVKPDYVVWSAGAAGKGGPEKTFAIDRDAATHFIRAAAAIPSVTRFLMVSYIASRRAKAPWWSEESWEAAIHTNKQLATYYQAKIAADEVLYEESQKRPDWVAIDLRPGTLTLESSGKVELGRTVDSRGNVSRQSVANVINLLLAADGAKSAWLDLLDGDEDPAAAVQRVVKDAVDASEGEPFSKA